jgi:hypothetical protein
MRRRGFRAVRGRITYANVAATLALVLAMSGGALAASHYLINSTKQINPNVLKKLHGARGARGALGPNGAIGPQGAVGPTGPRGPKGEKGEAGASALANLVKGSTESGDFAIADPHAVPPDVLKQAVTFSVPLAVTIPSQIEFTEVTKKTTNCLGPGEAAKGWLCIYWSTKKNLEFQGTFDPEAAGVAGTGRRGFGMSWKVKLEEGIETEPPEAIGTWTVTAG